MFVAEGFHGLYLYQHEIHQPDIPDHHGAHHGSLALRRAATPVAEALAAQRWLPAQADGLV